MVHEYADRFILVNEVEITRAIAVAWHRYGKKIGDSAVMTPATVLSGKVSVSPTVLLFYGGNIQTELHFQL